MPQVQAGQPCPSCGKKLNKFAWHAQCHYCGAQFDSRLKAELPKVTLRPGQREYKVVTQTDQWFMGAFSPDRLTLYMNTLASEGWRVIAITAADRATWFGSFGGTTRQEIVVFLERDVTKETTYALPGEGLPDQL